MLSSLFLLLLLFNCTTVPPSETDSEGFLMPAEKDPPGGRSKTPAQDPSLEEKAITPPALTAELLVKSAVSLLDEDYGPVIHQNAPWGLIHDLDKNGYADFLLLTLQNGSGAPAVSEELMDSRRLFEDPPPHRNFRVAIFYQHPNRVTKRYTIPLVNKLILQNFRFQEIRRDRDFPYTLSVSFQSAQGIKEEWIILHGRGISRFTVEQNLSKDSLVGDIDGDGFTDVVVHQRGFEDGSGYETFIIWYRWNGREFEVHETTNVVRNLRLFFTQTTEAVIAGGWQDSLNHRLEPEALGKFRSQGLGDGDVYSRFFIPLDEQENPKNLLDIDPAGLVFPSILENPFTYANSSRQQFPFLLKVQDRSGESSFFQCHLGMARNPFSAPQFIFLPVP